MESKITRTDRDYAGRSAELLIDGVEYGNPVNYENRPESVRSRHGYTAKLVRLCIIETT
jgi:hypothetical protein